MEEKLIQTVKNNPILYNNTMPKYRDANMRLAVWEEVGKELNIPGYVAKDRWDKLRRCYANAKHRSRDGKKKSSWKYEQHMSFLIPFIDSRRSYTDICVAEMNDDVQETLLEGLARKEIIFNLQEEEEEEIDNKTIVEEDNTTEADNSVRNDHSKESQIEKRRKLDGHAYQIVQLMRENLAFQQKKYEEKTSARDSFQNMDETDMFFLSMARMTKQLPKLEQAKIKHMLSNAVLSAEMNLACI